MKNQVPLHLLFCRELTVCCQDLNSMRHVIDQAAIPPLQCLTLQSESSQQAKNHLFIRYTLTQRCQISQTLNKPRASARFVSSHDALGHLFDCLTSCLQRLALIYRFLGCSLYPCYDYHTLVYLGFLWTLPSRSMIDLLVPSLQGDHSCSQKTQTCPAFQLFGANYHQKLLLFLFLACQSSGCLDDF